MKKGQVDPMQVIILFIILAIVAGIVIYIFVHFSGSQTNVIDKTITGIEKDTDGDGIPDSADPCPCDAVDNNPATCHKCS